MAPDARALVEDQARAATLLIEFADGTKLDTCAPYGPKKISEYLTLAPGEALTPPPSESPVAPQTSQLCPVVITKLTEAPVGSLNKTTLAAAIVGNRDVGHVGINYQNQSDREVLTVRFGLGYVNTMHELDHIEFADTREHKVKPGKSFGLITSTGNWSLGDPTKHVAWVEKILFVDGTYWNDNGSRSCASAALPMP